jgi:hypothetical protein
MKVQDQICCRIQTPAHIGRLRTQDAGRLPEEEVRIGIEVAGVRFGDHVHTRKSRPTIFAVSSAERLRTVKNNVRVMYHARVVQPQLQGADIARFRQAARDYEVAEDVTAASRQAERFVHAQD